MKRYLLDTGIASDFIHRRRSVPERVRDINAHGGRVGVCTPVVGELHSGVELSATRERNRGRLIRALSDMIVWPFDLKAAEEFGRHFAILRRSGRPMQQIDVQIAAVAFALGNCTVVTKDSDFSAVTGLQIENWASP